MQLQVILKPTPADVWPGAGMTAWIAGLSFVSANLGSLELMGYAGAAYQYGILAAHAYSIA